MSVAHAYTLTTDCLEGNPNSAQGVDGNVICVDNPNQLCEALNG